MENPEAKLREMEELNPSHTYVMQHTEETLLISTMPRKKHWNTTEERSSSVDTVEKLLNTRLIGAAATWQKINGYQRLSMRQRKQKTRETIQRRGKPSETRRARNRCWGSSGGSDKKAGITKPVSSTTQSNLSKMRELRLTRFELRGERRRRRIGLLN